MSKTKIKQKEVEKKLSDDQVRIRLLKTEVHYFKGLAIMVVLMTVCVFVAFGVLFSAMYLETRATRLIIQQALGDFLINDDSKVVAETPANSVNTAVDVQSKDLEQAAVADPIQEIKWLSFEKYGYKVYFPNSWTYLDKPFQKQIRFFADGIVRDDNSEAIGDLVTLIIDSDPYREKYESKLVSIGKKVGIEYLVSSGKNAIVAVVVPFKSKYLELKFYLGNPTLTDELIAAIVDKFEFSE